MRVRAGGKVVLVGEYAVLDGAPAWVAAVDRGVQCKIEPADEVRIQTPGDDRFARAALEAVGAPAGRYVFQDWRPVAADTKAGLGGSAAATVAGVVAGWGARGVAPTPLQVFRTAQRVHHRVQGTGSGVDVAASAFGGTIKLIPGQGVIAGPPVLPTIVFSGTSADTGPRVEQYLACAGRETFVEDSRALVQAFPGDPVRVLRRAGQRLRAMTERAGIEYWTPEIDAIVRLAEQHGGAAKPSGAGGGDVVVALFDDPSAPVRFVGAVQGAGFLHVPVALAPAAHLEAV